MSGSRLAVFIDLDDTLTDRAGAFASWATAFLVSHGLRPGLIQEVIRYDNEGRRPREQFFAGLSRLLGISFDLEAVVAEYRRCTGESPVPDGVETSLALLRSSGAVVCVLSNGVTEVQLGKLHETGLIKFFDHVIISDKVGHSKPSRQIFDFARALVDPKSVCWMVGDHPVNDISGAKRAGFCTAWVSHGRTDTGASRDADVICRSTPECLTEIVSRYSS